MEGRGFKSVVMCVLILGLVVEQIQVEGLACCPDKKGVKCYIEGPECEPGLPRRTCAKRCGCKFIDTYDGSSCPPGYDNWGYDKFNTSPNSEEAIVSDYCKLGCTSSLCDTKNTDVGSNAVEHCKNACSRFCTKGAEIAMVTA